MDVSVSGTIDQKTYLKKFRGGASAPLPPPWIRLWFFTIQNFLATLRLTWKTVLPWNFSQHWIYFLHLGCLSKSCLEFFTLLKYFYHSRILSNLRLPWKQSLHWNFWIRGGGWPDPPTTRLERLCCCGLRPAPNLRNLFDGH